MTPKEKAEELFFKFHTYQSMRINLYGTSEQRAKECALIAVELALEYTEGSIDEMFDKTLYLIEVKNEIERL